MWYFINNSGRSEISARVAKQILAARKAYRKSIEDDDSGSAWEEIQRVGQEEHAAAPKHGKSFGIFRKNWRSRK